MLCFLQDVKYLFNGLLFAVDRAIEHRALKIFIDNDFHVIQLSKARSDIFYRFVFEHIYVEGGIPAACVLNPVLIE